MFLEPEALEPKSDGSKFSEWDWPRNDQGTMNTFIKVGRRNFPPQVPTPRNNELTYSGQRRDKATRTSNSHYRCGDELRIPFLASSTTDVNEKRPIKLRRIQENEIDPYIPKNATDERTGVKRETSTIYARGSLLGNNCHRNVISWFPVQKQEILGGVGVELMKSWESV